MSDPKPHDPNIPRWNQTSKAAKLWMAILGLSLCFMGTAGGTYLWLSYKKARQTDYWIERPATVIVSTIDDSGRTQHNDVKFQLEVHYRFEYEGANHLSSRVKLLPIASRSRNKIEGWQHLYPVGKSVICYVNPDDPSIAILKKPTKAALYSIWFPALLILFGLKQISGVFSTKT